MSLSTGPSGTDSLWTWDGATMALEPDAPDDVRAVHLTPDGSLYASIVGYDDAGTEEDGLFTALHLRNGEGVWSEVLRDATVFWLAGWQDTAWAANADRTWTLAPCDDG
jgi:hypothetical protein